MKLIVGLGNPGDKYLMTRHNLGFLIVEAFLKNYSGPAVEWSANDKLKSEIAMLDWQPKRGDLEKVILAKPQTYMNNSGMAVSLIASYYKISPSDIWVVHDELDLPLGSMRIRLGGAGAGHHGIESVIEKLGSDKFWRFRMGIGISSRGSVVREEGEQLVSRQSMSRVEDYVLGSFSGPEKGKARDLVKHGSQALEMALEDGMEAAMNRFNTK